MPLPRLSSTVYPYEPSGVPSLDRGDWRTFNIVRGKSADVRAIGIHVSHLEPGASAHPPHTHPGEELCVMVAGALDVSLPTVGVESRIVPGQSLYVGADLIHGLVSSGEVPAEYVIVRWLSDPPPQPLPERLVHQIALDSSVPVAGAGPVESRTMLDATTDYLQRLNCTVVTLAAGGHAEQVGVANDTLIVVLEGEVTVGELGVVSGVGFAFVAAGDALTISNASSAGASHLAVELTPYLASAGRKLVNSALWYSRRSTLRRPMVEHFEPAPSS